MAVFSNCYSREVSKSLMMFAAARWGLTLKNRSVTSTALLISPSGCVSHW
jgi:hypothetical protein